MKSRILALFLAICLLVPFLPGGIITVSAAERSGTCGESLTWFFDDATGTLTISGKGDMEAWQSYEDVPWHSFSDNIENVVIEPGATSIGDHAFELCFDIKNATIPTGVTTIGNSAFRYCTDLMSIMIPDSVTTIGEHAFEECDGLTELTIPDSVTTIANWAFEYCYGLISVMIPESVTSIGRWAFGGCNSLFTIAVMNPECQLSDYDETLGTASVATVYGASGSTAESYATAHGYSFIPITEEMCEEGNHCYINGVCIFCEDRQIIAGSCGDGIFWTLAVAEGELTISGEGAISDYTGQGAPWYPYRKAIKKVSLSETITAIGTQAFYGCDQMTSVLIPDSVNAIGDFAFSGCSRLASITIPDSVTTINEHAFNSCDGLTSVTVPGSVSALGGYAFSGCSGLSSVIIENGVQLVGEGAFYECRQLKDIAFPESVTSIGDNAFYYCSSLTSITIPDSVATIGKSAFSECDALASVTFGKEVTTIGEWAFARCPKLESITIPDNINTIGENAFFCCTGLTSVTIGEGVTDIGERAFCECDNLGGIWVSDKNTCFSNDDKGVLFNKDKTVLIQCPGAMEGEYSIPESVTVLNDYGFRKCHLLEAVTIPKGVTSIGDYTFSKCYQLKNVTLSNSINSISYYAFAECLQLTNITIPDSVTNIDRGAFESCSMLNHVHFIGNMPTMDYGVFLDCNDELKLCYREDTEGWENCTYPAEIWDHTCVTDCISFTYTCNTCEQVYTYESDDAHSWDEGTVTSEPTCTEEGCRLYTCLDCGETKTIAIAPVGHQQGELVYETLSYWEYSCLNADHTFTVEKDPRPLIMELTDVSAAFTDDGGYPWVLSKNDTEVGCDAIKSSNQGMNSATSASTITFSSERAFTLSFDYTVSSETRYDKLTILLDGTKIVNDISGFITRSYTSPTLAAGTHTLTLSYTKDRSGDNGTDSAYIYHIVAAVCCPHSNITAVSAKEANCKESGNIAYLYCADCNVYFSDEELTEEISEEETVIPATGHAIKYTPKDEETHTGTCEYCNSTTESAHSYENGLCVCGQIEYKEPILMTNWKLLRTLDLTSDISINFIASKNYFQNFDMDSVYMISELDVYEGNVKTGVRTVKILPVLKGSYYYFTFTGLTAINMNDRIRSVLYGTKEGQPYYSATDDYSIADYAYSQMDRANMPERLRTLCADLLRYGAMAQIFKSYRTDNLADAGMTDSHRALQSDIASVTFGKNNAVLDDLSDAPIKWTAKALDLASKVTLKFIFSPGSYEGEVENLSLRLSYTDVDGKIKTMVLEGAELYNTEYDLYAFSFDGLLAGELRTVITAQVYEGETPVSCTLQYSADTYGNNKTGTLGDLCKALFAYSDSAKEYFVKGK